MKRNIGAICFGLSILSLSLPAFAAPVPEIDGGSAGVAVALAGGIIALIRDRKTRRKR